MIAQCLNENGHLNNLNFPPDLVRLRETGREEGGYGEQRATLVQTSLRTLRVEPELTTALFTKEIIDFSV